MPQLYEFSKFQHYADFLEKWPDKGHSHILGILGKYYYAIQCPKLSIHYLFIPIYCDSTPFVEDGKRGLT